MTWLSDDEELAEPKHEAFADVDAGLVIDHQLIKA
jgi:hypothetical protein